MQKITGTLRRSPLEGGLWIFETDAGERYHLSGLPGELEREGLRLELEGGPDRHQVGLGMMGPIFSVAAARRI